MIDELKGQPELIRGTPAILCSLPEVEEDVSTSMGVEGILVKPVTRQMLLDCLEKLNIIEGTLLIVDDEPDALQLFDRMLTSSGRNYRILLARDGLDALQILEECRPDAILLDLVMPNLDGFQFLEQRAQKAELQDIPIVIISARDPVGHPVMSNCLAVAQADGLSVRQLVACIQSLSQILSASEVSAVPMPSAAPPGLPA